MPRCRFAAPFRRLRLAAALLPLAATLPPPAHAGEFLDAAGRRVALPEHIGRVLPAERNAEVLLFVMAPDRLVGFSRVPMAKRPARPVLGWRPRTAPASLAQTALQLRPDLILDAGTVTPDRAAFADQVTAQTGIPYVLIDDSLTRISRTMRSVGVILGVDERRTRDLFMFAEHAVAGLRGRLLISPASTRPHVYYAIGPDGLTTALPGSPAGEALDESGAINVARSLGRGTQLRVDAAHLAAWDPEVIIAEGPQAYAAVRRSPAFRNLSAVRNRRVYLEPTSPFGWIEDPSGVNRLIGLSWLSTLFYPHETQEDLRGITCEFYDKFYRIKLTNAALERLVRAAGVPPVAPPQSVGGEPLVGLGSAPPGASAAAAEAAVPGMPSSAPSAACTPPGASSAPLDVPAPPSLLGPSPGTAPSRSAPGVPAPGRRGRPSALLNQPGAGSAVASAGAAAPVEADGRPAAAASPGGGLAYQYQTRP